MFGYRPDGRRIDQPDAILAFAPYLMPQRVDSQVASVQRIDCDILTRYIRDQRGKGHILSYLDLVLAAYVRTISQHPDLNRFIMNKQLYARNAITVSMVVLKNLDDPDAIQESSVKIEFPVDSTVYQVRDILQKHIDDNRKPELSSGTDKFASALMSIPGLPTVVALLARALDRYGLLPGAILKVSPFHTGLFFTSMASLGLPYVNHHIYNFGTTGIFLSMGKIERIPSIGPEGKLTYRRIMPLGVVSDERITSGAEYGRAFSYWRELLADPAQLEVPPENILYDFPPEKMPGYRRKQRKLRRAERKALRAAQEA